MKKILQKDEKVLRRIAKAVQVKDIKTIKIKKILKEMSTALKSQEDGVALAAPQIEYSLRMFIVSGKVLKAEFPGRSVSQAGEPTRPLSPERSDGRRGGSAGSAEPDSDLAQEDSAVKDLVFINPKISKLSREKEWMPEGCLSVRPLYGKTFRSTKAIIVAYDENGKKFTRGASGLLAQIFQHETDHLNGILFIDHAKDIKAELPQK
ncbi:MAG: Peptide deformylase [Parcubacteria group bacterium GW2011_GWB1_36_5]|nr:MAG: Peptide deformylase [Parcubacteria group bacterium GW2011_GWA2_36_24]KKQ07277.1 MAG: Peptide deformylase [Parcubacteria group bacterium GW2011_GWB1_36_5]